MELKLNYLKDRSVVKVKEGNTLKTMEGARIRLSRIKISGKNNILEIEEGARINRSTMKIKGENNYIFIGKNCDLNDLNLIVENYNGKITIGEGTTCGQTTIVSLEPNDITIGKDCMISYGVEIRNTDSHKMIDKDGNWINKGKSIMIGDHVWIGTRVMILKGTVIQNNSIVGVGSILSKEYLEKNSVIVGSPAKIIKNNISWNREEVFKEYNNK